MKELPVKKNEQLTVEIIDLTHEGLGVTKIDGYPLFIENVLPGEEAEILVVKTGKQFGYGKLLKLLTKSPDRVEVKNVNLTRTGIAPLQHLAYDKQLAFKKAQVENVMRKVAKMPDVPVLETIGMEKPFGYRNKAQIPVRNFDGKLTTGFFRKNSHDLVPIEDYFIQDPAIDKAINEVADVMRKFSVKAYNEEENTGNLRHIIIRAGQYSDEMMVVLVTRTEKIFPVDKICADIMKRVPRVTSIIQNINPEKTNVILGKENKVLAGKAYMEDTLLGNRYYISPQSFYQVNTKQAEVLYQKAIEFADLKPTDTVVDAYCGIGTIALSLANKVAKVYGVESIKEAVHDARMNAEINGIENVTFEIGKAETVMEKWVAEGVHANVLVVDPPRKGLAGKFIDAACEMAPEKIIYVSCNPATMARDCQLFAEKGYSVEKIQPVDMFPQTPHVECVVLMTRKKH